MVEDERMPRTPRNPLREGEPRMASQPPDKGDRIGEYILDERLGEGGFGEVWRAEHAFLPDKTVAIKIPTEMSTIELLRKEGVIQHKLDHPGIVQPLGLDLDHEPPYLLMEFVDGEDLRKRIVREAPMTVGDALRLCREILGPLREAHRQGVVHADLKPENVLLPKTGGVKLADFGLGRIVDVNRSALLRSQTMRSEEVQEVAGTIAYMSPEQRKGEGALDARTDIFAFGVLFFEMLAGELPVGSEVPSDVIPSLDPRLDAIYRKACARWDSRYTSVTALLGDIDAAGKPAARPERTEPETPKKPFRLRGGRLVSAAILAIIFLVFWRANFVGKFASLFLGVGGAAVVFFSLGFFGRRPREIESLVGDMIIFAFLVAAWFILLVFVMPGGV